MAEFEYRPEALLLVPEHLRQGLQLYIENGIRTGGGLRSILTNSDIRTVAAYCDKATMAGIPDIIRFLFNHAPAQCWGSEQRVDAWIERGGIKGRGE